MEYWEGGLELEKSFDPAFEDFIDKEVVQKTTLKQKAEQENQMRNSMV